MNPNNPTETQVQTPANPSVIKGRDLKDDSRYFTPMPDLSQLALDERSFDMTRLYEIAQVRESALPQFDGMGYMRWNETNEMADISYLAPKKNKGDSRITTGITHEKDTALVAFFLNLNFEGNVRVFYKGKEEYDAGVALTKLVRQSREQESYNEKRPQFYRNLVSQGTSFGLEQYVERWVPNKVITSNVDPTALDKVQWVEQGYKKVMCGCELTLIDGKKVFLEDIRQPDIQKQPGVYLVEYIPRQNLESIWGKTEMWKYVPYIVTPTAQAMGTLTQGSIYSDWIWGQVDFTKCEVVTVFRPFEQRFQKYINGIPMVQPRFPLKAVSPSGLIPIPKGDLDLMNMFAYSKSEPSKTKIDQAIYDEVLQNMIMKQRQSAVVPRINNTGKLLTPEMFQGGKFIRNVDKEDLETLIDNPGITEADFRFYDLFEKQISMKTISSMLEGNPDTGTMTLGQYMDMQKKQIMKLGGKMDGVVSWEKQMLKLRTLNLLRHAYQKDDTGNYKDIAMQDTMFDGTKGLNVIKFDTPNIRSPYDVLREEKKFKEQTGTAAEFIYLNPEKMAQMLEDPDYYLCYEIVPVDKNNDKLTQMMFVSMVTQAMNIFGPQSLRVDSLKKQYAAVMGKPYDDLFLNPEELAIQQQQQAAAAAAAGTAGAPADQGNPVKSSIGSMQPDAMFQ